MAERKPRGELAELSASLQNLCSTGKRSDKELKSAKREAFKKVINYMTLGMDMSALFPMMISCANLSADDLVLKKMLYLYITHYSSHAPDLALLTINQLQKDCRDQDPMVRGLALRSLCSLRVANFLEYVVTPVVTGLEDRHQYVRRTAVMGVLKLAHIDAGVVGHHGLLDRVKRLVTTDNDPQVVANCLSVLMQLEPPVRLAQKALVYSFLNRIKEFSDWGQCAVLELTSYYMPSSETEVYDILNALEDRMSHVNSAVIMAAIKVFLHHTINMPATHQQVLERIKEPLKTLISREDASTVYAALSHVLLLANRAPIIFEQDYISFYCRTHDPWYIKKLKMEILAAIATTTNVYDIVTELTEYARDISPTMAREAVRAVGRIALAVPDTGGIVERLLLFLDSGSEHTVSEALVQLKDVLRRYPDVAAVCVGQLSEISIQAITDPAARAAYIWTLGQFGSLVQDAPYLLESLVEGFAGEDPSVRLALLTGAAQLFFKRPPECQRTLGAALAAGIADTHSDVHDRALLYYRLLRQDPGEAERIIAPPLMVVNNFSESMSSETKDAIFQEFNSLSVVFQQHAASFIEQQAYHSLEPEPEPPAPMPTTDLLALEAPELLVNERATNLLADVDGLDSDLLDLDIGPAQPSGALQQPPGGGLPLDLLLGGAAAGPSGAPPYGGMGMAPQPYMSGPPQQQPQQQQQPAAGAFDGLGVIGSMAPSTSPYGGPMGPGGAGGGMMGGPASPYGGGMGGPPPALGMPGMMGGSSGAGPSVGVGPAGGGMMGGLPAGINNGGMGNSMLAVDDAFGSLLGASAAPPPRQQQQPHQQQQQAPPDLQLTSAARLSPTAFQDEWKRQAVVFQQTVNLSPQAVSSVVSNKHKDFTQHMTQAYIHTIASGGQAPLFKFYFYSQSATTNALYLVEMVLRADMGQANVTFKTQESQGLPQFLELWNACLTGFIGS